MSLSKYVPMEFAEATGTSSFSSRATSNCAARGARNRATSPRRPQLAGGFGFGAVERIYWSILDVDEPLQVVAVAGRNEDVRKRPERIPCPPATAEPSSASPTGSPI